MEPPCRFRFALLRCARLLGDEMNAVLLEYDLNYSLWQSLVMIKLHQPCIALDLAEELQISKPAVTKRLNVLFTADWVEQIASIDKRQKMLQLSALGEDLFEVCCQRIDLLEAELLKGFDVDALKQAHGLIFGLMQHLQVRKELQHEK